MIHQTMLSYVSIEGNGIGGNNGNNNKFYYVEFDDTTKTLKKEWGRIGSKSSSKIENNSSIYDYKKAISEKTKKGYAEVPVIDKNTKIQSNENLFEIAMEQVKTKDEKSKKLLNFLIKKNIHNIVDNTSIKYDNGVFSTPLGIISKEGVEKAKSILDKLTKLKESDKEFQKLNEEYFFIIPTPLKNLRDTNNLLNSKDKINKQYDICDSLLQTLEIIKNQSIKKENIGTIFDTSIEWLADEKEFKRILEIFENSKNKIHGSIANQAKLDNIYKINISNEKKKFNKKIGNIKELFHGTKMANLLSILKTGLLLPNLSPGQATGYMFGRGLYFSDQSTKSLNYCDGMYWAKGDKNNYIYMFLADVAMGNEYIPSNSTSNLPPKGYHSYFAKAGQSGVINNEMIVFEKEQVVLKYILEIKIEN